MQKFVLVSDPLYKSLNYPHSLHKKDKGFSPILVAPNVMIFQFKTPNSEVQKVVEQGSNAPRRILTELILAEGFWTSLPHLSQFPKTEVFIQLLQMDQIE